MDKSDFLRNDDCNKI